MNVDELLGIAREIVGKAGLGVSITNDPAGVANARVVQTSPISEDWSLWFLTDRRSRKVSEIEQSGRMTMLYQHDPGFAYVSLAGSARINGNTEAKEAIWNPASVKWHPGGPADPNVVIVKFITERIELWSSTHGVVPDPRHGLWAAALTRTSSSWSVSDSRSL